jgi:type IV secretory pathway TrbL component
MSDGAAHSSASHGHGAPNTISIPWVVLASVLMGIGVLMLALWLVTFNFLLFTGSLVLLAGFLMIFSPRMGSDHA